MRKCFKVELVVDKVPDEEDMNPQKVVKVWQDVLVLKKTKALNQLTQVVWNHHQGHQGFLRLPIIRHQEGEVVVQEHGRVKVKGKVDQTNFHNKGKVDSDKVDSDTVGKVGVGNREIWAVEVQAQVQVVVLMRTDDPELRAILIP